MAKTAWIKSTHLQPDHHFLASHVRHAPKTPGPTNTSDSDTYTPFLSDADVSSFSGSGIGWLTTDASRLTLSYVDYWLISEWGSWERDIGFDRRALIGEISANFLIRWLPGWSINGDVDAYRQTQIYSDGGRLCLFKIPDINIHLSIYQRKEGHISRTADSGTHW